MALPRPMPALADSPLLLAEPVWRGRQRDHEARVQPWIEPHRARAARGEKHPVWDFLFHYYAFRPSSLRQWHPGPDAILAGAGAAEFLRWPDYRMGPEGLSLNLEAIPERRRQFARWLHGLLTAMRNRPPFYSCFGLHEWAMVYRQPAGAQRHEDWPLRHAPEELARIVEASALCCSHFDAFRFFTAAARPRNKLQPARAAAGELEQRGCLHANMDLYKWAFKLAPYAPSELIADAFALAREIRETDMRASPYDLRALGFEPIAVETAAGRADYERRQRAFAARGEPLRERLIALCGRLS
jgi:hypothetical protein